MQLVFYLWGTYGMSGLNLWGTCGVSGLNLWGTCGYVQFGLHFPFFRCMNM